MNYKKTYKHWCEIARQINDVQMLTELLAMDDKTIEDSFYKDLEFGTAGLRGIIGAGTNRLNKYTIAKASAGVSLYAKDIGAKHIIIAYDTRNFSDVFAKTAATVFASFGLKVSISRVPTPMPFLSYVIRYLQADFGVMITASHNPKIYNGYKLSDKFGVQIGELESKKILENIRQYNEFTLHLKSNLESDNNQVQKLYDSFDSCIGQSIFYIDNQVFNKYISDTIGLTDQMIQNGTKVVFTPLNGAGYQAVPKVFKAIGMDPFLVVEQSLPNGEFPTCPYPNPEKLEALQLGLDYCKKYSADVLIATDPDADRVGVVVLHNGEYRQLSGNEVGVLLANYLLQIKCASGKIKKPLVIRSIVTTSLVDRLIQDYGGTIKVVPTGFKYIGQILQDIKTDKEQFLIGFEESCGYLIGTLVRDKDAVVASMFVALMVDYYKGIGLSLVDVLQKIYDKYGTYTHILRSYEFVGLIGENKIKIAMQKFKNNIKQFGSILVNNCIDYNNSTPSLNMVEYNLIDGTKIIIRPSGTEPLIKVYFTFIKDLTNKDIVIDFVENTINQI